MPAWYFNGLQALEFFSSVVSKSMIFYNAKLH